MKKIAHCIHHTHWDLIWYFTVQDAAVQFSYNMQEMLRGFRDGEIEDFFMDGQTAPIDEYLLLHPEDEAEISELVRSGKLMIGPFNSQLDCFISNGESVINNLRIGMKTAKRLGKVSKVAYLPDSFGHSYDFPKIFRQFGIKNFVITRGVGDDYGLGSEFYMQSNDGSQLLVYVMIAGYGYGCYGFKDGTLLKNQALDYNKISVTSLIDRLLKYSTLDNEFVFPLGFDQNPAILDIPNKMEAYNKESDKFLFKSTTWEAFCQHVRKNGKNLKTHKNELFSTQYHRVHRSMFSARADIKALQDRCERILTYELQPMMTMLDSLGITYDHGLIDKAWETLVKCQTHSSATLTDETNDYIERETKNALNLATSSKMFLMKLTSLSLDQKDTSSYPLVIFHTLPIKRKMITEMKIFTKTPNFHIVDGENQLFYTVVQSVKKNCGVLRKDVVLSDSSKFYYETDIVLGTSEFDGISYQTYDVMEDERGSARVMVTANRCIENQRYQIYQDAEGIVVYDKLLNRRMKQAVYLEESGDEGDSFDYSYPDYDLVIKDYFDLADASYHASREMEVMEVHGVLSVPSTLSKRKRHECDDQLVYRLNILLKRDSDEIEVKGEFDNVSEQHRVRFVVTGSEENDCSYAGTQFGYLARAARAKELETWREDKWFEEPSATYPLLNHVSMVNEAYTTSVMTRSSKEYELMNDGCKDLAITIFRSYGAMGYPDLNRRPGRPSGLDYMVFETPKCQMKKTNRFEIAIRYSKEFDANKVCNAYTAYACETSAYQHQDFDKSIHPIAYFPTNERKEKLPKSYAFMRMDGFKGSFGTLVKSDSDDGYIIRLYNNDNVEVEAGECNVGNRKLYLTNLEESEKKEVSSKLGELGVGELRVLKIK